jgi:hypothetical protein
LNLAADQVQVIIRYDARTALAAEHLLNCHYLVCLVFWHCDGMIVETKLLQSDRSTAGKYNPLSMARTACQSSIG